jgi:hypothetical protein
MSARDIPAALRIAAILDITIRQIAAKGVGTSKHAAFFD